MTKWMNATIANPTLTSLDARTIAETVESNSLYINLILVLSAPGAVRAETTWRAMETRKLGSATSATNRKNAIKEGIIETPASFQLLTLLIRNIRDLIISSNYNLKIWRVREDQRYTRQGYPQT